MIEDYTTLYAFADQHGISRNEALSRWRLGMIAGSNRGTTRKPNIVIAAKASVTSGYSFTIRQASERAIIVHIDKPPGATLARVAHMKGFIVNQYLELLRWGAYAAIACSIMTALGLLWINIRLDTIERDLRDIRREMYQQKPTPQQPPIYP